MSDGHDDEQSSSDERGNDVFTVQVNRAVGTTFGGECYWDGWIQPQ